VDQVALNHGPIRNPAFVAARVASSTLRPTEHLGPRRGRECEGKEGREREGREREGREEGRGRGRESEKVREKERGREK
jgi:hypothetical protein